MKLGYFGLASRTKAESEILDKAEDERLRLIEQNYVTWNKKSRELSKE